MAYNAPNTIPAGNPLQASAIKGNDDALKVYLHEGVDPRRPATDSMDSDAAHSEASR